MLQAHTNGARQWFAKSRNAYATNARADMILENAVEPTRRAPDAVSEESLGRRFAGRCSPAASPIDRFPATAPQRAKASRSQSFPNEV